MRDLCLSLSSIRSARPSRSLALLFVAIATLFGVVASTVRTGPIVALEAVLLHARAAGESTASKTSAPTILFDRNADQRDTQALKPSASITAAKAAPGRSNGEGSSLVVAAAEHGLALATPPEAETAHHTWGPHSIGARRARAWLMVFLN